MKPTTRIYIDSFLQNIKNVCFFTFLPVLIAKLGATAFQIALSTSLPPLFCALSLALLTRQLPLTYDVYYRAGVLRQLCFLCMAFSPLLPNPILWLLFFWSCNAVTVMVTSVQGQSLIKHAVEEHTLVELFSKTKIIAIVVGIIGTYFVGSYLDAKAAIFPYNYVFSMVLGALATFSGMSLIARLAPREKRKIKLQFVRPLKVIPKFLIVIAVAVFGLNLLAPVWTIYHVNELQLSNLQIGIFVIASGIIGTILIPLLRKKIDFWGPRRLIIYGCFVMAITAMAYGFVSNFYFLLLIQMIRGLAFSYFEIAQQAMAISESKHHIDELAYFSDYQMITNIAAGIAPFLSVIALKFLSVQSTFVILGFLSLLTTLWVTKLFKHMAAVEAAS